MKGFALHPVLCMGLLLICAMPAAAANWEVKWNSNTGFSPSSVTIAQGDTVIFYDNDSGDSPVEIVANDNSFDVFLAGNGYYQGVTFNSTGTYGYYDNVYAFTGSIQVVVNYPPTVSITAPTNNAAFTAPANFSITADAADTDGDGVYGVEFLVGTNVAGVVFSPPYNVSVTNLNAGTYTLSAIAMDNLGAMASNSVSVTVGLPVIVLAPPQLNGNNMVLLAGGLVPGTTNILETSSNLVTWTMVQTNIVPGGSAGFTNTVSGGAKFYRVLELQ